MRGFTGEYTHSIDSKGRLIIPAKFRENLGDTFTVTRGLDGCLFVYADSDWEVFAEKLGNLRLGSADARKFTRYFLGSAIQAEVDKQGRILISAKLREAASLTKDVTLVGVGNRIEIWDKDTYEEKIFYDNVDDIAEKMEGLGV